MNDIICTHTLFLFDDISAFHISTPESICINTR
jgi:hypothetical protein